MTLMRILFFSSIFPRPWNTTRGIYCLHVCRALLELGHEVRAVSPRSWLERLGPPTPLPGLAELRVEYPLYLYPPGILHSTHHRFLFASSQRAMRRTMSEFRPDCIVSYWAHPDGAVAAQFARAARIPSGVIVGGSDVLVLARRPGLRRRSVVRALNAVDAVVTVGSHLADTVVALGIPRSKVHVVHQGVDESLFSPGPADAARRRLGIAVDGKVLVSVGSLLPVKGIDVLLQALALRTVGPDVRLYLVGDGSSRRDLEALSSRLGLVRAVTFVGKVDQASLPDWYRAADLTVLSSRSEGVPNVLRESLACGTPFVAARVGGVDEIAEGTTNRLVSPEDPAALAAAVAHSLAEPRPSFRPGAFLSWKESAQQLLDVVMKDSRER